MSDVQTPMPKYRCHKEVWALKIASVEYVRNVLSFVDPGYAPRAVSPRYINQHDPKPGGYFVVYEDGYQSFSPAEPFESGYTRI